MVLSIMYPPNLAFRVLGGLIEVPNNGNKEALLISQ